MKLDMRQRKTIIILFILIAGLTYFFGMQFNPLLLVKSYGIPCTWDKTEDTLTCETFYGAERINYIGGGSQACFQYEQGKYVYSGVREECCLAMGYEIQECTTHGECGGSYLRTDTDGCEIWQSAYICGLNAWSTDSGVPDNLCQDCLNTGCIPAAWGRDELWSDSFDCGWRQSKCAYDTRSETRDCGGMRPTDCMTSDVSKITGNGITWENSDDACFVEKRLEEYPYIDPLSHVLLTELDGETIYEGSGEGIVSHGGRQVCLELSQRYDDVLGNFEIIFTKEEPPVLLYCGDGTCNADETSYTCPEDCGSPPSPQPKSWWEKLLEWIMNIIRWVFGK